MIFSRLVILSLLVIILACQDKDDIDPIDKSSNELVSLVDSANYNKGILIYSADQRKRSRTEFNSLIAWDRSGQNVNVNLSIETTNDNPYLLTTTSGVVSNSDYASLKFSFFKELFDQTTLPDEIGQSIKGVSFNAWSINEDFPIVVEVKSLNGSLIASKEIGLSSNTVQTYFIECTDPLLKQIEFIVLNNGSQNNSLDSMSFGIDDIYLDNGSSDAFYPPESDQEFLSWLKRASFNFFDWNYLDVGNSEGVVLESYTDQNKISLSGIGYSYAIYVIAQEEGFLNQTVSRDRIMRMLRWQQNQNWFDGSGGWHGFPHHYFKPDGNNLWPDVSTIDWAICAAGIRIVKQYYPSDSEVVSIANELLSRPDWTKAIAAQDKIAMGFDGYTGERNPYRWGLAFSEETELVYLEAVASGDLDASVFDAIIREKKNGFYPSWFGAGFTYNWLQLWTGTLEHYKTNAIAAFNVDASTSQSAFGRPLMRLTACSTVKEIREEGFLNWSKYISNQGGSVHGASPSEVIQISPAPYGAALALPFTYDKAMTALREFSRMGYYHEYLGLPDNVRIRNLPEGLGSAPNWDPFDINIGPIILAIEQAQDNRIGILYQADPEISNALTQLIDSFPSF